MRTMQQWFDEYGVSHQNSTNKAIHWICVPVIFFSLIGLLSLIPHGFLERPFSTGVEPYIHWGTVLIVLGLLFFLRLSFPIFLGMVIVSSVILYLVKLVNFTYIHSALLIYLGLFVLAWIGQFIGHKIEGQKPSFLKDLQFLMIGPAWLLHFIYKKLGIGY